MKIWQKMAVRYGATLGIIIVFLNIILTFIYLDPTIHSILSYLTAPLIIFFSGFAGYKCMAETRNRVNALLSSVITVAVSLLIGFSSLFILNLFFVDIVSKNPFMVKNYMISGEKNIREFIISYTLTAATQSTVVSLILGIISGTIGGFIASKTSRQSVKL